MTWDFHRLLRRTNGIRDGIESEVFGSCVEEIDVLVELEK